MNRFVLFFFGLALCLPQTRAAVGEILAFEGSAPTDSYQFLYHQGQTIARQDQRLLAATDDGKWTVITESDSHIRELLANDHLVLATTDAKQTLTGTYQNGAWTFQTHSHPGILPFSISAGKDHFIAMVTLGDEDFPENVPHYTTDGSQWLPCENDFVGNFTRVLATPKGYLACGWSPMSRSAVVFRAETPDAYWAFADGELAIGPIVNIAYNAVTGRLLVADNDFAGAISTDLGDSWIDLPNLASSFSQTIYKITTAGDQFIATGDATYLSQYGQDWNQIPSGYYTPLAFAADSDGQIQTFSQAGSTTSHFSLAHLLGELYEVSNEEALGYLAQTEPAPPEVQDDTLPHAPEAPPFPTGSLAAVSSYQTQRSPSGRIGELVPHRGGLLAATENGLQFSPDGKSWTAIAPEIDQAATALVHTETHLWFTSGAILYRTPIDHIAPEVVHEFTHQDKFSHLSQLAVSDTHILVRQYNGATHFSADGGKTFAPLDAPWGSGQVTQFTPGEGRWMLAGFDSKRQYHTAATTDFQNWTLAVHPEIDGSLASLAYGNGVFVATARDRIDSESRAALLTSTDGREWTAIAVDDISSIFVRFSNGRFVIPQSERLLVSADGLRWKTTEIPKGADRQKANLLDGQLISHGQFHYQLAPLPETHFATAQPLESFPIQDLADTFLDWDLHIHAADTIDKRARLTHALLARWHRENASAPEREKHKFTEHVMFRYLGYETDSGPLVRFFLKTLPDATSLEFTTAFLDRLEKEKPNTVEIIRKLMRGVIGRGPMPSIIASVHTPEPQKRNANIDFEIAIRRVLAKDVGAALDLNYVAINGFGRPQDPVARDFWLYIAELYGFQKTNRNNESMSLNEIWEPYREKGSAAAYGILADAYYQGEDLPYDPVKAFQYALEGNKLGSFLATHTLHNCYLNAVGTDPQPDAVVPDLLRAAEKGYDYAHLMLGLLYFSKWGEGFSDEKGIYHLKEAARLGNSGAYFALSEVSLLGRGTRQSQDDAIAWLKKVPESNASFATERIAKVQSGEYQATPIHPYNKPRKRPPQFDVEKMTNKANSGDAAACYDLSYIYRNGYGVYPDSKLATQWWKQAVENGWKESDSWEIYHEQGSLVATYQHAIALRDGSNGFEKDFEKSNALFFGAGYLRSHYTAQAELGFIYQNGRGNLEPDPVQALSFLTMAAKNGDPSAQLQLGYLYDSGDHNFPVNEVKAATFYKQSADSGNRIALANLAHLYDKGLGVEKNHRVAGAYYLKILAGRFVYRPHHYREGPSEWLLDRETTERVIGRDLEEMASIHTYHIVKAAAEEGAPYAADLYAIILTRAFGCLSDHDLAHRYHSIAKERSETIYNDAWFDKNAYLRSR